ncbi:pollen receptor-like kinase 3 [Euphorbia lathyris]|uniref:pollen receptor-like kinase 3 n=1 Tax=Euphorbia lathyris TaxID=212925 RepID=UPI0033143DC8
MTVVVRLLLLLLLLLQLSLSNSLSENEALLELKKSFTNAQLLTNWLPDTDPCQSKWLGCICFAGRIQRLHLSDLGLSGKIDVAALQQLQGLRTISFINNSFTGPIPEFNKLGALKSLLLSENKFTGEIPNDFFAPMSSLKKLWLSDNKFTGQIPQSVTQLSHLIELHLERNQFTGPIPPLKNPKLTSFSLANNLLQGEIPSSFSSFNASSFQGNEKLCGKPLNQACPSPTTNESQIALSTASNSNTTTMVGIMVLTLIAVFVALTIYSGSGKNDDGKFNMLEKENLDETVLPVRSRSSSKKSASENSSRRGGGSRRGSQHGKHVNMGDLIMVNDEKGSFGLQDLMKAAAEVLGSGGLGSAYKAQMTSGLAVVVKRMREMNMMGRDLFDAEMRRFGRIRHKNILTPLAYHFRKEEKLLVSEYMPKGSLLYVLHGDRGICHAQLNWATRVKIVKGIAEGLSYLHTEYSTYNLPHGNLKSSNVLLNENYEPVLGDYALDPLTNLNHSSQTMFAYKTPEYIQKHVISPKSDVYCLGIIILEIMTGKFPSQYLTNGKGGTDVVQWVVQAISEGKEQELIDPEVSDNSNSETIKQMVELLRIGAACTEADSNQRLDMREAIRRIQEIQV